MFTKMMLLALLNKPVITLAPQNFELTNFYMNQPVRLFAIIAFWEGISYILLLGIAMPLKYYFEYPMAVKVVGWAHGVLFMAYVIMLILCWTKYKWRFTRVALYFIASLLPFLPFTVERKLKQEYQLA
jgi:integral membrane protein